MNDAGLAGRAALITGGARGVGRAVAEALAQRGAALLIADNGTGDDGFGADPQRAVAAAEALGGKTLAFADSIASPGAAQAAVARAVQAFGGLDIVVNAASIRRDAPLDRAAAADWEAVIRNNLSAAFYVLTAAIPVLRRHAGGRIVNIVPGQETGDPARAAAGAGLLGLTRAAARDLAGCGVTCNAVAPATPAAVGPVVGWLCGAAAQGISGRLLTLRDDAVLLADGDGPVLTAPMPAGGWTDAALSAALAPEP